MGTTWVKCLRGGILSDLVYCIAGQGTKFSHFTDFIFEDGGLNDHTPTIERSFNTGSTCNSDSLDILILPITCA